MPFGPNTDNIVVSIKRTLRFLVIATCVLYLIVGGLAVTAFLIASTTKDSLCSIRTERQKSVAAGELFLKEHPKGAFGFSPAQIQKSINEQKDTINSLSRLSC